MDYFNVFMNIIHESIVTALVQLASYILSKIVNDN